MKNTNDEANSHCEVKSIDEKGLTGIKLPLTPVEMEK